MPASERYHPLTLAFLDDALERRYRIDEAAYTLSGFRLGLWGSFPLWLAVLGIAVWGEWPERDAVVRLVAGGMLPLLAVALLVLRYRHSFRWIQTLSGAVNLSVGLGVYQVCVYVDLQEAWGLYCMLLVALFIFFLHRSRFVTAIAVVPIYTTVALARHWVIHTPTERAVDILGVLGGVGTAAVASWLLERTRRDAYFEQARLAAAHAELRETQAQLVQAEKMASLGRLVAGVAHDMNTPLGAVSSTQQTLAKMADKLRATLEKEHPAALESKRVARTLSGMASSSETLGAATQRLDEVVTRLRSFARLDEASLQDASLGACVDDALAMVQYQRPEGVEIVRDLPELPALRCYPSELNQLIVNLVVNALDALGEAGRVTIRATRSDEDVALVIEDDGPGIAPEHLGEVFDPGFTTKGVGVGGGYGLSIAYRIAERHGGTIEIDSEVGSGTTVTVRLPLGGPPS